MHLSVWIVLVIIGVFDAREYRIPNMFILFLLFLCVSSSLTSSIRLDDFSSLSQGALGFFCSFFLVLPLYLLKVFAAGDVKLSAVIGFVVGYGNLTEFLEFTIYSSVFIGTMYLLLNQVESITFLNRKNFQKIEKPSDILYDLSARIAFMKSHFTSDKNVSYMPFAPILIVGLAMYQYFKFR